MVTVNSWLSQIRTALNNNAELEVIISGDWLFKRQTSEAAEVYGVLMLKFARQQQSTNAIYRWYTLTAVAYTSITDLGVSATTIPDLLAETLDFQGNGGNVSDPVGGAIIMITPKELDQELAKKMKSGYDVGVFMSQWTMQVAESRA